MLFEFGHYEIVFCNKSIDRMENIKYGKKLEEKKKRTESRKAHVEKRKKRRRRERGIKDKNKSEKKKEIKPKK